MSAKVAPPYRQLAQAALVNALRLHKDARLLYENGRLPSALALAVIADEEAAKCLLNAIAMTDSSLLPGLESVITNHRAKQALAGYWASYADVWGPMMKRLRRLAGKFKEAHPNTSDEELDQHLKSDFVRVARARLRRRRTPEDREALIQAGNIQDTKNNALYVGHDGAGAVVTPSRIASKPRVKKYLSALDDRMTFLTFMIIGNVKGGHLDLEPGDIADIKAAWPIFVARYRRRS